MYRRTVITLNTINSIRVTTISIECNLCHARKDAEKLSWVHVVIDIKGSTNESIQVAKWLRVTFVSLMTEVINKLRRRRASGKLHLADVCQSSSRGRRKTCCIMKILPYHDSLLQLSSYHSRGERKKTLRPLSLILWRKTATIVVPTHPESSIKDSLYWCVKMIFMKL